MSTSVTGAMGPGQDPSRCSGQVSTAEAKSKVAVATRKERKVRRLCMAAASSFSLERRVCVRGWGCGDGVGGVSEVYGPA